MLAEPLLALDQLADDLEFELPAKDTPRPTAAVPKPAAPKPADTRVAAARPPFKPTVSDPSPTPAKDALVAGAQPIVPSSSFESRFSAMK